MRLVIVSAAIVAALVSCAAQPVPAETPAHHTSNGFRNPEGEHSQGFFGILRARFGGDWQTYDADRDRVPTTEAQLPAGELTRQAAVTWIGHATVLLQHRGVNVLTDPMFSAYASPVSFAGPRRITEPALQIDELPPIHAVIISHDHYDHLDVKSIRTLGDAPMYYVPLGVKARLEDYGISPARVVELDWWESRTLEVGGVAIELTSTPTQHFSGRTLWDRDRTLWASWSIAWTDFNVWFGGDTGYNDRQFKEIGERLGPFDLGIIPIGAYEPRWFMSYVHVDPAEAVQIHQDIGARRSFGMHWGAFILSGEGVMTPPLDLASALEAAGLTEQNFATFAVGESRLLPVQQVADL